MSNQAIIVSSEAFHTIMLGRTKALLLIDNDIPGPGDVLTVGMKVDKAVPYLQVRVTCVEEFNLEDGPWHFVLDNMAPEDRHRGLDVRLLNSRVILRLN